MVSFDVLTIKDRNTTLYNTISWLVGFRDITITVQAKILYHISSRYKDRADRRQSFNRYKCASSLVRILCSHKMLTLLLAKVIEKR